MPKQTERVSLLKQFSLNENKISQLYSVYVSKFPEQASLWERLAKDEKRHATLLSDLDNRFNQEIKNWQISDNAPAILDYIGKFIDDCLQQAKNSDIKEALNNALSLEQSMIEKKNFDIFSTVNPEITAVLEKLNRETEGHRLGLMKFLKDKI